MSELIFPLLTTDRLMLRELTNADSQEVRRMAGEKEVACNTLNMPYPYLEGMAEEWIESLNHDFQAGRSVVFGVCQLKQNKLAGAIGLTIRKEFRVAEMGYWIGREYWNQGYCTEAVKAILLYAFDELNLHKVFANYFANNPASGRVMQKAGMHFEAILKSHMWHWGEYKDLMYYSIFNPEHKVQ